MKKIFYLMRHGQTHANAQHDVPKEKMFLLTELGIQQAKQAGIYLKTMGIDHYYTSTLQRTKDTLRYAVGETIEYQSLTDLNEMELGTGKREKVFANE